MSSNNPPVTPPASIVSLPIYQASTATMMGPRSELLGTPTNAAAAKPLNPFADDAIISNNLLIRRPGSSPQPITNVQSDLLRRPAVTVDAIIKTNTTTAGGLSLTPTKQPGAELKSNWYTKVSRKHPVKLLNYARLFAFLPLLAYVIYECMSGSDWRHNEYRFDGNGSSRTLLSLSGVERVVRTGFENQDNAAMLSELTVSYKSIVNSPQCDFDSHIEKASAMIGQDKPLDVARVNQDRNYRLAVFSVLYGPTYRDVDCRALQKFRVIGIVVKIFLCLALTFILAEWLICLAHFSSSFLMDEAVGAYEFIVQMTQSWPKSASICAAQQPPPFLLPVTDEWVPIDMATGGITFEARSERPNAVIDLPPGVAESNSNWINQFWWTPVLWILEKCGVYSSTRGDVSSQQTVQFTPHIPKRELKLSCKVRWLPVISFLEGSTFLLSIFIFILITGALFIWSHQTDQPACLNADTELESCQNGSTFSLTVAASAFAALEILCHAFAGHVVSKLDHYPRSNEKWT